VLIDVKIKGFKGSLLGLKKKLVISSAPALGTEFHVTAIYARLEAPLIF
jgi:hypothetical protein